MRLTLVRNATLILELAGRRILVDPMLDEQGARPPIGNTANQVPNPTVPLPFPAEEVVRGLDAIVVTHRHRDHLDGRAEKLLPRDIPVFCQPEDAEALLALGLDARPVHDDVEWDSLRIVRTPARHGHGAMAEALAPVADSSSTVSISPATPSGTRVSRTRSLGTGHASQFSTPQPRSSSRAGSS